MRFYIYGETDALNGVNVDVLCRAVEKEVASDIDFAIEFLTVDEEEIRRLNAETRGIDKVTDVLSYPTMTLVQGKKLKKKEHPYDIDENGRLVIGSVVICSQRAKEQAQEYGHSYERELHYLLVHGVMHCLGYDHVTDEEKTAMRAREEAVLSYMGINR